MTTALSTRTTALGTRIGTALLGSLAIATLALAGCGHNNNRPTEQQIAGLFDEWNATLAEGDANAMADLYAADGVLLPTLSPVVRGNREQIAQYFATDFLPKKPQGTITESHIRIIDDESAAHSGTYRFTLTSKDGSTDTVDARFTYVYKKIDNRWLIVEHHSSASPDKS
ncbi:SgcJ/EcaC family oxidoreductase [Kribbella deserti]|uniref:SgcJ/EcaC family oxidoreductase n=1 Tax=Kribbella deserti TaxID=1926257 RepID=A0ABV6QZ07_9ACTN